MHFPAIWHRVSCAASTYVLFSMEGPAKRAPKDRLSSSTQRPAMCSYKHRTPKAPRLRRLLLLEEEPASLAAHRTFTPSGKPSPLQSRCPPFTESCGQLSPTGSLLGPGSDLSRSGLKAESLRQYSLTYVSIRFGRPGHDVLNAEISRLRYAVIADLGPFGGSARDCQHDNHRAQRGSANHGKRSFDP